MKKNKILWFLPILIVVCSYLLFLIYLTYPLSEFNIEKTGQIGDSFGILNSLFSGFAFVALIMTIYLQQEEINSMKKELEKQNFENIFFLILEKFNTKQNNDLKSFDKQFENRYQKFEEMRYKLLEYFKYWEINPKKVIVKAIINNIIPIPKTVVFFNVNP